MEPGLNPAKGSASSSTITVCTNSLFAEQPDPLDCLLRHFIPFFLVSFFVEYFVLINIRNILDGIWCSLNFSPDSVLLGTAAEVVCDVDRAVVVEITEHVVIESYPSLRDARLACGHARLAVDDAGAGFASLRHILELEPDFVKLDVALVHDIDAHGPAGSGAADPRPARFAR